MNEVELELSRLFSTAVGEPPRRVTLQAVRRKVVRRRIVAGASASTAAILAVSVGVGVAVSASPAGRHQAAGHGRHASSQGYYFEAGNPATFLGRIRAVATGAIKARRECPRSRPYLNAVAAANGRMFFLSCSTTAGLRDQIYSVVVSGSGSVSRLQPVRGGSVGKTMNAYSNPQADMAVTADGSELAFATGWESLGGYTRIIVINTKTGTHAAWRFRPLGHGKGFGPLALSFARHGSELAVFGLAAGPGAELIVVNHAPRGGSLGSGQVIFRQAELGVTAAVSSVQDAFISPDGATAVVAVNKRLHGSTVYQVSAATGRPLRVLLRLSAEDLVIKPNSAGRVLFIGFTRRLRQLNGWIDHGRLIPLKSAADVRLEAW
jgi:hypothetical protein